MPASCFLVISSPTPRRVALAEGDLARGFVLGRGEGVDLRLEDPHVSREHCRLFLRDGLVHVEDLGSRKGTWCGPMKVTRPVRLRHGDTLFLGPVEVQVELPCEAPAAVPARRDDPAQTVRIPARRDSLNVQVASAGPGAPGLVPGGEDLVLRLDDLPVGGFTIGRDPACGFSVDDLVVSRRHARIDRTADGYVLTDLSSTNGTFVNGRRIVAPRTIGAGDVLSLGPYHLTFDGHNLVSSRPARGGTRIEALGVGKEVRDRGTGRAILLLRDVNLAILPGQFVGFLGSSGCGKSTLMDALNGRRPATYGQVLYDGVSLYDRFEAFKGGVGYVPQQLVFHEDLPLAGALRYTSRLRLSRDTSRAEIEANIDRVLETVGLAQCRHTRIRDLSGGQKKRVSAAMELLSRPRILFLDEVTSGLDLGTEQQMMQLFRGLADDGITVVCITHYVESLEACDAVTYLVKGRVGFHGPPGEFKSYFGIDAFRDIYRREADRTPEEWQGEFRQSAQYRRHVGRFLPPEATPEATQTGADAAGSRRGPAPRSPHSPPGGPGRWKWADFRRQLLVCARRHVHILAMDRRNLLVMLGLAPAVAMLICLVCASLPAGDSPEQLAQWQAVKEQFDARLVEKRRAVKSAWEFCDAVTAHPAAAKLRETQLGQTVLDGLGARLREARDELALAEKLSGQMDAGLAKARMAQDLQAGRNQSIISFGCMLTVLFLGLFGAVREIVKDDAVYRHERFVNLQILPYLLGKMAPLAAIGAVQTAVVLVIVNTWTPVQAGSFLEQFALLFLMSLAGTTLGLAISAGVPNSDWAVLSMIAVVIPQILFAGALIPVAAAAGLISRYLIVSFWGFQSARSLFEPGVREALTQHLGYPGCPYARGLLVIGGHVLAYSLAAAVLLARKDGPRGVLRMLRLARSS